MSKYVTEDRPFELLISFQNDILTYSIDGKELYSEKAVVKPAGMIRLNEYSEHIINKANTCDDDGIKGIISRRYHMAIKYALCHMASSDDIYRDMTCNDLEYGIIVSKIIADWKIETLVKEIVQGEFHKKCKIFKSAIRAAIQINKRPTGKILINRRPQLKNLISKEWNEIVKVLVARKEIIVDNSRKSTIYLLRFEKVQE